MSTKAQALEAIYGRLASAPTFHPANADLFTDWTIQGGDILTVNTNNVPHLVPVYSMQMKWTGKPKVTVQSTGDEEMPSIESLAQQKSSTRGSSYRRGIAAAESDQEIHHAIYSEDGYLHTFIDVTASNIRTEVGDEVAGLHSEIEQTASYWRASLDNSVDGLHAEIVTTASEIRTDIQAANSSLYAVVSQTATNFHTEVTRRAKVFVQLTDPASDPTILATLTDGDIWIKSTRVQSWNDMSNKTWSDASAVDWNRYTGAEQFVWDDVNNRWEPVSDKGHVIEWGTKIEQNEKNISLIARAIGSIDPSALAQLDVSTEAIQSAVSTSKSELYSVIRQTATNIVSYVVNEREGTMSYIDQTASSLTQTIARKNKVFVMMTDPVLVPSNNVIDGDIWIKSVADDKIKPTWNDLNAKSWSSQSTTNWRDYYSGAWYVRKNGAWAMMREDADVVEIGTKLEQDEKHIALIARDVDANHQELGSRLEVTAQHIRGEVHAAKSTLYSVIEQTATQIRSEVASTKSDLQSSITQTASSISTQVSAAKSVLYSTITQTASQIRTEVANTASGLASSITQTASKIALVVDANGIKPAAIVAAINDGSSSIIISATHIDLDGYVKATDITTTLVSTKLAAADNVNVKKLTLTNNGYIVLPTGDGSLSITGATAVDIIRGIKVVSSGNGYKLQAITYGDASWHDLPNSSFSRATSLSGAWSSGKYTVTASPQGNTDSTILRYASPSGSVSKSGTSVSRTFKIQYGPDDEHLYDTGFNPTISIDASGVYDDGWYDGYDDTTYVEKHGLIVVHSGHTAIASGSVGINGSYNIWPAFKKYNAAGTADEDFIYGNKVVISGPSMTQYGFIVTGRTQDSSGYHYTLTTSTGFSAPWSVGDNPQLYKKN